MARDVRNLILERLADLIRVQGVSTSARNMAQGFSDGAALPGVLLMDGSEEVDAIPSGRENASIYKVTMLPVIHLTAMGDEAVIGNDMNAIRFRIIAAVLADTELAALTAEGKGVRFLGTMTKWSAGRGVQGDMVIRFSILYYLRSSDF